MNKYIVPIADLYAEQVWNEVFSARSISECQEKIIRSIIDQYDFDEPNSWEDFIEDMNQREILIGEIKDIETL